jgi:biopolymer transport protein ExbD
MTPMVDLACLLLTFFMLTTAFNKAKVMEIVLPDRNQEQDEKDSPQVDDSKALSIILIGNDKILWYKGLANPAKPPLPTMTMTDFSDEGIRRVLLQRNKDLFVKIADLEEAVVTGELEISNDTLAARRKKLMQDDKVGPFVFIKAADDVKYRNVVDIFDEMAICNIARFALVDINAVEKKMVADFLASQGSGAAISK